MIDDKLFLQKLTEPNEEDYRSWLRENGSQLNMELIEAGRNHAETLSDANQLEKALGTLDRLAIASRTLAAHADALVLRTRALVLQYHERIEESISAANRAAELYEHYATDFDVAKAKMVNVQLLGLKERFEDAIKLAHEIRPHFEHSRLPLGEARVTHALAYVYMMSSHFDNAANEYERAKKVFDELGSKQDIGYLYLNQGILADLTDNIEIAEQYFSDALANFREQSEVSMAVKALCNLARIAIRRAAYQKAFDYLAEAQKEMKGHSDLPDWGFVYRCQAQVHRELSQFEQAKSLFEMAIQHFGVTKRDLEIAETQVELARLLAAQPANSYFEEAVNYLASAESILQKFQRTVFLAWVLLEHAELLLQRNRSTEAEQKAYQALQILEKNQLVLRSAQAQTLIADAIMKSKLSNAQSIERARMLYETSLQITSKDEVLLAIRCLTGIGKINLDSQELNAAQQAFTEAIELQDSLRRTLRSHSNKAGFGETRSELYEFLLNSIQRQISNSGDTQTLLAELLIWQEKFKGIALAELLALQPVDNSIDMHTQHLIAKRSELAQYREQKLAEFRKANSDELTNSGERGRAIRERDAYRTQKLSQLSQELQQIEDEIQLQQEPALAWREGTIIGSDDVHRLLNNQTILISYYAIQDRLFALTVGDELGDLQHYDLEVRLSEIESNWAGIDTRIQQRKLSPLLRKSLASLYQKLIAPLAPQFTGKERLIILPYRGLAQLPFAALYDSHNDKFLLEQYSVQLAPSATILNHCCSYPHAFLSPLLIECPGEKGTDGFLEYVEPEVAALKTVLTDAVVASEMDATPQYLLSNGKDRSIIHFAGHAYFDLAAPMQSALILYGGQRIFASDLYLYHSHFRGATIVLSACETGRTRAMGGDHLGLTSALLYAGAAGIVSSLWPVFDQSAAVLMQEFYKQLTLGEDTCVALQKAQITLLHSEMYAAPYYWAPFTLVGDSRKLKAR